jgi:hypothetical protein
MRSICFFRNCFDLCGLICSIVMQNFLGISQVLKYLCQNMMPKLSEVQHVCVTFWKIHFFKGEVYSYMKVGALDFYLLFKLDMLVIIWVHYTALLSNDFNMNLFLQKRLLCQECNTKICNFKKKIEFWINDSHKISKCCNY